MSRRALPVLPLLLALAACPAARPTSLPVTGGAGFDPTTYDGGVIPDGELPTALAFGVTPFYSPGRQEPMLARMERYLTESIGVPVRAHVSPTYEACIDELARGGIDVAQLSPYAFVEAESRIADLIPVAVAVAQGSTSYASYLVVRRDDGALGVDDIRGKRLGFVDRLSTSGFLYPSRWLREHGFDVERDFTVSFLGSHDKVYAALVDGTIDVAAISSDTLVHEQAIGLSGPVRIIAKTGRIPYDVIVVRGAMAPRTVALVRRAFLRLSIHEPRTHAVLEDYNLVNGFMPLPPGHYDEVRRAARAARAGSAP